MVVSTTEPTFPYKVGGGRLLRAPSFFQGVTWSFGWTRSLLISLLIRFLENLSLLWLYFPVIVCYGISRDCLLGHVIFFVVIFYGYKLQSMDCTCMSTFFPFLVDILSVPFLHSFEWLMVQSMDPHALLPSLFGGLLGLLLFPTSAFYFHSSN